jgi:2-amino-4-hydroxy-6-hydroxymethyldihydropteridine diphosphokinase
LDAAGVPVERVSPVYETAPRDLEDQPSFLNAACRVASPLDPPALLAVLKGIERSLGRVPGRRYGPRAIDLDILVWEGGAWNDDALQVPHPRLAERRFALVPLLDLDPDLTLPGGEVLGDLAAAIDAAEQPVRLAAAALTAGGHR